MKRIRTIVAKKMQPYGQVIKWISWGVNILAVVVLGYWVSGTCIVIYSITLDQEPLLAALTMLFALLNQVHQWLFVESEYSPAQALALGYVSNFLSPLITQLVEDGERNPTIYIYKPKQLMELEKDNLDRMKAEIKNKNFELNEVNMKLKNARARDILTIQKSKRNKVFFDFPNTLTSLVSYIDYKVRSNEDTTSKKMLTQHLIDEFYETLDELANEYSIAKHLKYCDSNLSFDFN